MDINTKTVKSLRQQRGWSQQHLADACEVSLRTIQRAEKDGRVSPDTLQALCAVLEVTPKSLSQVPDLTAGQFEPANPLRQKLMLAAAMLAGILVGVLATLWVVQ